MPADQQSDKLAERPKEPISIPIDSVSKEPIEIQTDSFSGLTVGHARTRNGLAWLLSLVVVSVFLLDWGTSLYLSHNRPDSIQIMSAVFDKWIPTFVALLVAAVGFYFNDRNR
jgi:hypothetical protein